jgi:hypothetical protein
MRTRSRRFLRRRRGCGLQAWIALVLKYGMPAMQAALGEHMLASRFFPLPAEIRERIEAKRPAPYMGFVPLTPRRVLRLTGQVEPEMSYDECAGSMGVRRQSGTGRKWSEASDGELERDQRCDLSGEGKHAVLNLRLAMDGARLECSLWRDLQQRSTSRRSNGVV